MRLFVAVEVPAEARAAVAGGVEPARAAAPRLRWVEADRYHLTLVFLGSVDLALLDPVAAAVAGACEDVSGFEVRLDGSVGRFGRRVLWAGLERSESLSSLAASVTAAVRPLVAIPDADRPYSAHLTLARSGREPVRAADVDRLSLPALSWRVERVVLMRSAGGYVVERAFPLRDANA